MFSVLIAVLIFVVVVWLISILPLPATGSFPLQSVLYALAAIVLILFLVGLL